jgi:hypothetical protein
MPYAAPTPPLMPDGSPLPTVDGVFHANLPPLAMPPPRPAARTRLPQLAPGWVMAGRVMITSLHAFIVLCLGIAGLFLMAFNDDPSPDQNIPVFFMTILLIVGGTAVALLVLTGGIWLAKRWAYWATLVLYSGVLGFVAVAWGIMLTHPTFLWRPGLLPPFLVSLLIPGVVLGFLVMTWPTRSAS